MQNKFKRFFYRLVIAPNNMLYGPFKAVIQYHKSRANRPHFKYTNERTLHSSNLDSHSASFIPGRILFVNQKFCPINIENKMMTILHELRDIQNSETIIAYKIESLSLLYERLPKKSHNLSFEPVDSSVPLSAILSKLPKTMVLEILCLASEFQKYKPEIVQAFTIEDSIRCGLAGLIAGVPKIILCCFLKIPFYLLHFKPYFFDIYETLLSFKNILFVSDNARRANSYSKKFKIPNSKLHFFKQGIQGKERASKYLHIYFDMEQVDRIIFHANMIRHERGNCWSIGLPSDFPSGDGEKLWTNKVLLKEDDLILGPAHSVHDDITLYGNGSYSHWSNTLFFSSSDNTNPKTNNRLYRLFLIPDNTDSDFFLLKETLEKINITPEPYIPGRVLLVNDGLGSGGTERQVVNTLLGLQNQELESIALLCINFNNDFYLPYLKAKNIPVYQLTRHIEELQGEIHGELNFIDKPLMDLLKKLSRHFVLQILNLILEFKHQKPEIVHAWLDTTSLICGIAAVIAGVPKIILSSRSMPPFHFPLYSPYMKPLYMALSRIENIIFLNNSERGAREYCQWLELPASRFQTIRNGVDLSYLSLNDAGKLYTAKPENLRAELGIPEEAEIVGSIFRFSAEKRPLLWIKIALAVAVLRPNCHFILIGKGVLEQEMKGLVKQRNLEHRFHFLGELEAVSKIIPLFDLFLLTSECEGTPNVILEAEWLGVPVIALEAGGVEETVLQGETGLILHDTDPEVVALAIKKALENTNWRKAIKYKGPAFIDKRFGLERMIKETMAVYGHKYTPDKTMKPSHQTVTDTEYAY